MTCRWFFIRIIYFGRDLLSLLIQSTGNEMSGCTECLQNSLATEVSIDKNRTKHAGNYICTGVLELLSSANESGFFETVAIYFF